MPRRWLTPLRALLKTRRCASRWVRRAGRWRSASSTSIRSLASTSRCTTRSAPDRVDPETRGRILLAGLGRVQLAHDVLGQHLAELHAPLIERVDAPDHT